MLISIAMESSHIVGCIDFVDPLVSLMTALHINILIKINLEIFCKDTKTFRHSDCISYQVFNILQE